MDVTEHSTCIKRELQGKLNLKDKTGVLTVSTVHLPYPELQGNYETMIQYDSGEWMGFVQRYETKAEAIDGHDNVLTQLILTGYVTEKKE